MFNAVYVCGRSGVNAHLELTAQYYRNWPRQSKACVKLWSSTCDCLGIEWPKSIHYTSSKIFNPDDIVSLLASDVTNILFRIEGLLLGKYFLCNKKITCWSACSWHHKNPSTSQISEKPLSTNEYTIIFVITILIIRGIFIDKIIINNNTIHST